MVPILTKKRHHLYNQKKHITYYFWCTIDSFTVVFTYVYSHILIIIRIHGRSQIGEILGFSKSIFSLHREILCIGIVKKRQVTRVGNLEL